MIRDILPAVVRKWIYIVLSTAYGLEMIFDLVPAPIEGKVMQALAFLGFTLAAGNTSTPKDS